MSLSLIEAVLLVFVLGSATAWPYSVMYGTPALIISTVVGVAIGLYSAPTGTHWRTTAGISVPFILALANTVRPQENGLFESISARTVVLVGGFVVVMIATVPALPAVGADGAANRVVSGEVTQSTRKRVPDAE